MYRSRPPGPSRPGHSLRGFPAGLRRSISRPLLAMPLAGALALAAAVIPAGQASADGGSCRYSGSQVTCTFYYTGKAQPWRVPEGVTSVTFVAYGAQGTAAGTAGGLGAAARATFAVRPGAPVEIVVGGAAGFNGGGAGGCVTVGQGGGSGGGASDVRMGNCAYQGNCELGSRVLIGAGGGGGGGGGGAGGGGGGGYTGGNGGGGGVGGGGGGGGATQVTYGVGGGAGTNGSAGADGTVALGGGGGSTGGVDGGYAGGGGGGGLYGGGGGGSAGVNGGAGGGGGGGASYGPRGTAFDPSTLGGNGRVTVTFTPPLQVTTSSLPAATGGVPYSATLTAHGGVKPYTWSVTSGSLPPGMTLDSFTGVISGTSDVTGTYQFMVTVKDSEYPRMTASAVLSIAVSGPVITAVRPDNGPDFGGTPVMITGTGLSCPPNDGSCTVQVTFGGHSAEVEWAHPDQIAVVSPPGTGTVTITVTVAGVSSQATNADLFGYGSGL